MDAFVSKDCAKYLEKSYVHWAFHRSLRDSAIILYTKYVKTKVASLIGAPLTVLLSAYFIKLGDTHYFLIPVVPLGGSYLGITSCLISYFVSIASTSFSDWQDNTFSKNKVGNTVKRLEETLKLYE